MHHAWPAVFAVFAWWFSTGAIIYLDGLPQKTFKWSMAGATLLAGLSLWGLWTSSSDPGLNGVFCAFASALGLWAWHEMSFYMGYVTGPRKHACAAGCRGWRHLGHALMVSLWHELAILAAFGILLAITWGAPNRIGLWTFAILWGMHESARLNVVLGVRNVNAQFLPSHLAYLESFLNKKPMNALFPVAVTAATALFCWLVAEAAAAADPAQAAGMSFLAAMAGIGVIEHWILVLPVPAEALWNWGMRSREGKVSKHSYAMDGRIPHEHGAPGCRHGAAIVVPQALGTVH